MSAKDGRKNPSNDASYPLLKQEKFFNATLQDVNAVFEIGLSKRWSIGGPVRGGSRGVWSGIEFDVGPVGEEPVESNQNIVGEDFLFNATFGLAVKVFDDKDTLADLVKLLDAPSAMVDVDEPLERIALGIQQSSPQAKDSAGDVVFDES